MDMTEHHHVAANGDYDRNMADVEMAGNRADEEAYSSNHGHSLAVPSKPRQKSISSHFREIISPTIPPRVTYPDIEIVSPESQIFRQRKTGSPTSQNSTGLDMVSPETIREQAQIPNAIQEVREVRLNESLEELGQPRRPMSFVSSIEAMSFEGPSNRFEMPRAAPSPLSGHKYHMHQSTGSQDQLLKFRASKRTGTGNWFIRRSVKSWLMELLSFLLSVVSVVATIIVLRVYERQPVSKGPRHITLNSLLAIFITLAQVGLILPVSEALSQLKWIWFKEDERPLSDFDTFDQASRSPIGAIKLLRKLGFEYLASIGAIISITALAISPFTQQIVSYQQGLVPATSGPLAQAARSDLYLAYNPTPDGSGVPKLSMQQAVKMSLFNAVNESIPAITPSCQTGNCTFPEYSSLGICSKIVNVTNFLTVSPASENLSSDLGYLVNKKATLPNGVHLNAGGITMNLTTPPTIVNGIHVSPLNHSLAFTAEPNAEYTTISNFFVIWQNEASQNQTQGDFNALEILLHWCVSTYSTTISAGIPNTTITNTSTTISSTNTSFALPLNDGTNSTYQKYNATSLSPSNSTENETYVVDGTANSALKRYMANTFRGTYAPGIGGGYTTDAAQAFVGAIYEIPDLRGEGNNGIKGDELRFEGVKGLMSNIGTGMTNNIRLTSLKSPTSRTSTSSIPGTSWVQEPYIHISWAWLSYLILLLILSFLFLVATIIKIRRANVDVDV